MNQFHVTTLQEYRWARIHLLRSKQYGMAYQQRKYWEYMRYLKTTPKKEIRLEGEGATNGIMFVGTNPSTAYKPELGLWGSPYGIYFGKMLDMAQVDRNKVWVTNLFKYPTRDNRPLKPKEIEDGLEELDIEMDAVAPTKIIAFGAQVCKALSVKPYEEGSFHGVPVFGLPHPSYINRYASKDERGKFIMTLSVHARTKSDSEEAMSTLATVLSVPLDAVEYDIDQLKNQTKK